MANEPSSGSIEEVIKRISQLYTEEVQDPLQIIRELLEPWRESSDPSSLQPAALESLNDSGVLRVPIEKNWDDVLQMMLSLGLQIRETDMTFAIHYAKERQSFKALINMFESGWDINRPVNSHCPPAMRYVFLTDRQRSQDLLTSSTLIDLSLLLQHRDVVEICLSMGASPDTSSLSGHTTMQRAVAYAPLSTIKLLVDHGAPIADTNLLPHAALAYIDTAGEPGIPSRLEVIKYLIDQGASINAFYGDTLNHDVSSGDYVYYGKMNALHFAIVGGKRDLVDLLLENGANTGLDTWSGWKTQGKFISSVELAQMCGFEDIASILRERIVEQT